jgi:hypothetical protein
MHPQAFVFIFTFAVCRLPFHDACDYNACTNTFPPTNAGITRRFPLAS